MHYLENTWSTFLHLLVGNWIPYLLGHWQTISISIGLSLCLALLLITIYFSRGFAWVHRVINMFMNSGLQILEVSSWFGTVRCSRASQSQRPIASIPPPSLLGDGTQRLQNLTIGSETITYMFPENPHGAGPIGIAFPTHVTLLYKTGTNEVLPLCPVILKNGGEWRPAKIHRATNIPVNPFHISKRDLHEYRNFYLTEFVEIGDVLGAVVPKHERPVAITAPVSGRIVHLGAFEGTPLGPRACPFLIAAMPDIDCILAPEIGTFIGYTDDQNLPIGLVGNIVKSNTAIGSVHFLGGQSADVVAPCDLVILRQYVNTGQRVDFNSRLFLYTPLC
ncbi:MAG: hypothetical protein Q8O51_02235 [bacterium]|nr:hypothetical protein [bacterium]